jgi:transposase
MATADMAATVSVSAALSMRRRCGVRVWLAVGRTDMRRGMNGLALQVQEALRHDPNAGDLFVFRGAQAHARIVE